MPEAFAFELVSPEKLVLSERAMQVVVPGTEGYFTVMANHAPVMATIKPGVVEVILESGDEKRILIRGGFADVSPDGLTLLAEYAADLADFDMEELNQHIANASEDVADAKSDLIRDKAQLVLSQLEEVKTAIEQKI